MSKIANFDKVFLLLTLVSLSLACSLAGDNFILCDFDFGLIFLTRLRSVCASSGWLA